MADEKVVPIEMFITTAKTMLSLILGLTVEMQVQRVAILRLTSLPAQPEELKNMKAGIEAIPEIRSVQEAILSMTTTAEVTDVLRRLEALN